MNDQNWNQAENSAKNNFDIKQQIERYFSNWKWFVLSTVLCIMVAFLYLRYTTFQYYISTTLLVKIDKKGSLSTDLGAFTDIPGLSGGYINLENETEVVRSRILLGNTISDLNL
jgi:uncharacterized protein involved in exopolysaccharide biosynthesis